MATLTANISASEGVIPVSGAAPAPGSYFTVGSEAIRFLGTSRGPSGRAGTRAYWSVDRGVAGTTAATHTNGATLTQYYPDAASGGGGGVTVDNGTDPPTAVTTLVAPGALIDDSTATLGPQSTREQFNNGAGASINSGSLTALEWASIFGDAPLLDLTDPAAPTVIAAGTYAVSVSCGLTAAAGKQAFLQIELDALNEDAYSVQTFPLDGPAIGAFVFGAVAMTYYLVAGATIKATVKHNGGSALSAKFGAVVQILATPAS